MLINPVLTPLGNEEESGLGGLPLGARHARPGAASTRLRYQGVDASRACAIDRTVDGFHARVVQHEVDHLDGILYPMRMRDLTKFGFQDVLFPGSSCRTIERRRIPGVTLRYSAPPASMAPMENYDVIVIGTGPAGEGAAMMLAKNHRKRGRGGALYRGGWWLHALGHHSQQGAAPCGQDAERRAQQSAAAQAVRLRCTSPCRSCCRQAGGVIDAQVQMRRQLLRAQPCAGAGRCGARFIDANTLEITPRVGDAYQVQADRFVIATGSRPYHPPGLDFSHPRVLRQRQRPALHRDRRSA